MPDMTCNATGTHDMEGDVMASCATSSTARLGCCHRCGDETSGALTCGRCTRAIYRQSVRLGVLTETEASELSAGRMPESLK